MGVAVVTDSTSDIEPHLARELRVRIVPLFVIFGERSYRDRIEMDRAEFYRRLAAGELPKTSQPSPELFEDAFTAALDDGNDVLCIVVSSKLSGTINAARAAAQHFPKARIAIVDSHSVSAGLGMQVRAACAWATDGVSRDAIVARLEGERRAQRLYACLPDLSHLVRTGRIGKARAAAGTMMKIVPVLSLRDGEIYAEAQVRTFARARERMLDLAVANVIDFSRGRFAIIHTNSRDLAAQTRERLRERIAREPAMLEIVAAGPVVASHGGAGALGIFSAQ